MAKKARKDAPVKAWLEKLAKEDPAREHRIIYEIVVDAYNEEERNLGWYYYLENELVFPFKATCIDERQVSPLTAGEEVEVVGLADEDECRAEMFVLVEWDDDELAVPLRSFTSPAAKARRCRRWRIGTTGWGAGINSEGEKSNDPGEIARGCRRIRYIDGRNARLDQPENGGDVGVCR